MTKSEIMRRWALEHVRKSRVVWVKADGTMVRFGGPQDGEVVGRRESEIKCVHIEEALFPDTTDENAPGGRL